MNFIIDFQNFQFQKKNLINILQNQILQSKKVIQLEIAISLLNNKIVYTHSTNNNNYNNKIVSKLH